MFFLIFNNKGVKKVKTKTNVNASIDKEVYAEIEDIAEEEGRSFSNTVNELLKIGIEVKTKE